MHHTMSATIRSLAKSVRSKPAGHVPPVIATGVRPPVGLDSPEAAFVSPAALHAICFRPTLDLLKAPGFPLPLVGMVVTDTQWTLTAPLLEGHEVDVTASVAASRRTGAGVEVLIRAIVARGDQVIYAEETCYLAKGATAVMGAEPWPHEALDLRAAYGTNAKGRLDVGAASPIARRKLARRDARTWARNTGDVNPIHVSSAAARIFGYSGTVLHGAAAEAWAFSELGVDGSAAASGRAHFRAPIILPRTVELVPLGTSDYAILDDSSGRDLVHLRVSGARVGVPQRAVALPRVNGKLSSTKVTRSMVAAAEPAAASAVGAWRSDYRVAFEELTRRETPASAVRGLDYLRDTVCFADGTSIATARPIEGPGTDVVRGHAPRVRQLVVPFEGKDVRGAELAERIEDMAEAGLMRPGARGALLDIIENPEILDLTGWTVASLGAGAELSAVPTLLSWGANVAAPVREGSRSLDRLARIAAASAGRLSLPTSGLDVADGPEEVAGWLLTQTERIVIVDTLYAPGREFLRAAIGADIVEQLVCQERSDTALAWLGSPTDDYAMERQPPRAPNLASRGLAAYARVRKVAPSYSDGVYRGLINLQGPNYAAAKRIGRWRATVEREKGRLTSYNVAPMATTASVTSTRALRAAYVGLRILGLEPMEPTTAAPLMAALLAWDLVHGGSRSLTDHAIDSALFASPYEPDGLLGYAVALGTAAPQR